MIKLATAVPTNSPDCHNHLRIDLTAKMIANW
jgi:hypothetical protein